MSRLWEDLYETLKLIKWCEMSLTVCTCLVYACSPSPSALFSSSPSLTCPLARWTRCAS